MASKVEEERGVDGKKKSIVNVQFEEPKRDVGRQKKVVNEEIEEPKWKMMHGNVVVKKKVGKFNLKKKLTEKGEGSELGGPAAKCSVSREQVEEEIILRGEGGGDDNAEPRIVREKVEEVTNLHGEGDETDVDKSKENANEIGDKGRTGNFDDLQVENANEDSDFEDCALQTRKRGRSEHTGSVGGGLGDIRLADLVQKKKSKKKVVDLRHSSGKVVSGGSTGKKKVVDGGEVVEKARKSREVQKFAKLKVEDGSM